jgi:hypothetical protein
MKAQQHIGTLDVPNIGNSSLHIGSALLQQNKDFAAH